ncbi:MAG TPA: TetR/AcrR family transcriptional regulator [Solirubrobacteraceae bacterium]|jgi:AcrR family transcriptional regulator|nr:TetR/AcrR family transcriptional regulator [Solirubrobacteraceae bacterium]
MPVEEEVRRPPRERLLEAARELFYAEGVHTVGVDRVIERAGVAKASLYSSFGSKEGLVRAYLEEYHDRVISRRRAAAESESDPVAAILAVFDSLARDYQRADYNGCAFSGARAEEPAGGPVDAAARAYRAEMRDIFRELCVRAGAGDPDLLAWQLQLIYSGGAESAKIERNPEVPVAQRAAVETLIRSALASP